MRTTLLLKIDHDKELPKDIVDIVAARLWTVLFNQGIKADVSAGYVEVRMQPREWENIPETPNALRKP